MSKRISTDGGDSFGSNPFDGMNLGSLPAGSAPKPLQKRSSPEKKKASKGRVEVRREKAGRGGKTVTSLSAFPTHIPLKELESLAFDLKKASACGGTLKGRVIELQGDVRDRVILELEKRSYQPVLAGG
ncbi:MAG: translation initiation factor [Verrucomicrobiota bacterium]